MKTNYLFPNRFKKIGWGLIALAVIATTIIAITETEISCKVLAIINGVFLGDTGYFEIITDDIGFEVLSIVLLVGGLFVTMSKEKVEDEFISKIRLESLVWATFINYGIITLAILFVYDISFLYALTINIFSLLIIFSVIFHWKLFKSRKALNHEE